MSSTFQYSIRGYTFIKQKKYKENKYLKMYVCIYEKEIRKTKKKKEGKCVIECRYICLMNKMLISIWNFKIFQFSELLSIFTPLSALYEIFVICTCVLAHTMIFYSRCIPKFGCQVCMQRIQRKYFQYFLPCVLSVTSKNFVHIFNDRRVHIKKTTTSSGIFVVIN